MIQVICPNNNVPERNYVVQTLFVDVLGCDHNDVVIQFSDSVDNYELLSGNRKAIVEDHFFNHHKEPLSYLERDNLPTELSWFHGLGMEVPIIYGEDKFVEDEQTVVVGLDVFGSTFFMLTRWEESLMGREEKGDCDESQLFCVKNGIHQRPVVNEYAELLSRILNLSRQLRKYSVVLSHDVDGILTPSWARIAKDAVKQTIHGKPKNKVLNLTWREEIKYKCAFPSAFSQFEMYTKLAENYDIQEWFYFKVCGKGENEATYLFDDEQTKEVVENLSRKNNPDFVLGFHPSQNMFGNEIQWNKEVDRITELLQGKPVIGRNHHLLYNHDILRLWESISDAPMNISNCVFHKRQGFRSGVCVPYHLFDLYQRRVMNLIEHPCQIMDTVIRYDAKVKTNEDRWMDIQTVINYVKRYQGELVLTWHIYIRNRKLIQDYFQWCEKVVHYAVNEQ